MHEEKKMQIRFISRSAAATERHLALVEFVNSQGRGCSGAINDASMSRP